MKGLRPVFLVLLAAPSCGSGAREPDLLADGGTQDAGTGDAGPLPDRDGDGIPDDVDPNPEVAGRTLFEDDFERPDPDAWTVLGSLCGKWGWTDDGRLAEVDGCSYATYLAVSDLAASDVYVGVRVSVRPSEHSEYGLGAGPFARMREAEIFLCMLQSSDEDDQSTLTLVRTVGFDDLRPIDSAVLAESLIDRWPKVVLLAEGELLICRVEGIEELVVESTGTQATGSFGLAVRGPGVLFDDFLAVEP